ncbi:MAG: (Fe-S)-binding protein [Anaerolineales bacterium]|nr:(Fe-S)-binding protein [Anaerolineales bacterium]
MNTFAEIVQSNQAWLCLDCGKCSSVCPITLHLVDGYTSPRLLVEGAVNSGEDRVLEDPLLWSCLTCQRCTEICPSGVQFSEFIHDARQLAWEKGQSGDCTHSGTIQSWMRMMTDPALEQNRLDWIDDDLRIAPESEVIYFPGCLPYYDTVFGDLDVEGTEIARAAVKILNHLGIEPMVLENERCCGHDSYWQGDMDTFRKLAELNLEAISQTGAKRLVTTCPECAYTLKSTYPEQVGSLGLEVLHITELLAEDDNLQKLFPTNSPELYPVTYQDPCRLGRFMGIYQQPRDLIQNLGYQLVEMDHYAHTSTCCGTSCWTTCGQLNKKVQSERLMEARSTGAEKLITSCVKCQIHYKCAQRDPISGSEIQIDIQDLTTLIAEKI